MAQRVLIRNGRVVDGTGSPWFRGDVAFSSGRIMRVGNLNPGDFDEVIDACGLVVSPGIIDIHSHSDFSLLMNPEADSFIRQGVTTVFNGNCGMSAAPLNEEAKEHIEE
ncbi:amidohydrolase family protein, partial [Candidatus Bathyarchaeota archaeon]|nr:amidohydrolase family protein [Candidatus Bathyarchaeota archaeon]